MKYSGTDYIFKLSMAFKSLGPKDFFQERIIIGTKAGYCRRSRGFYPEMTLEKFQVVSTPGRRWDGAVFPFLSVQVNYRSGFASNLLKENYAP
jgi:hypothetical protein